MTVNAGKIFARAKNVILSPRAEWATIEAEDKSVVDLYKDYVVYLALIPPFASNLGAWLFGFSHGPAGLMHETLSGALLRASLQYVLSLPLLYVVGFVFSNAAEHFDGKADDRKAFTLAVYSFTPIWVAAIFGLVPGLRWLDVLGFYGVYIFHHGLTRMLRLPKDNADVFTLVALVVVIAAGALHGWLVHLLVPWQAISV